jgi:hypothetical protein
MQISRSLPVSEEHSPSKGDAPRWLVPLLSFVVGCVVTAGVLMPSITTPDYVRGSKDGYKLAMDVMEGTLQQRFETGYRAGKRDCLTPTQ